MTVRNTALAFTAAVTLMAASTSAMAHHKPGHTANCHAHPTSPYCSGNSGNDVSAVPVPGSMLMLGSVIGAAGIAAAYRRRRNR